MNNPLKKEYTMKKIFYTLLMLTTCGGASAQDWSITQTVLNAVYTDIEHFQILANTLNSLSSYEELPHRSYVVQPFWSVTTLWPTDQAFQTFVDPVSCGSSQPQVWVVKCDMTQSSSKRITADVYNCSFNQDGTPTISGDKPLTTLTNGMSNYIIKNRMTYLLDNSIIMEPYRPEKHYYKTLGNSFVRIVKDGSNYKVYNSTQNPPVTATAYEAENGLALTYDNPIVPNRKSVAATLAEHPEFSEFLSLLQACDAVCKSRNKDGCEPVDKTFGNLFNQKVGGSAGAESVPENEMKANYLLDGYHYTIYAPTNEAIQQAYAAGLPTPQDLKAAEKADAETEGTKANELREVMLNFVKYHIQDNAIFIDNGFESGRYATAKSQLIKNEATGNYIVGAPYKLSVNVSSTNLTVTDHQGNTRRVLTSAGLHNLMANEYWANGSVSSAYSSSLNNYSFAVIHAIDGPLLYDDNQFKYEYKPLSAE